MRDQGKTKGREGEGRNGQHHGQWGGIKRPFLKKYRGDVLKDKGWWHRRREDLGAEVEEHCPEAFCEKNE